MILEQKIAVFYNETLQTPTAAQQRQCRENLEVRYPAHGTYEFQILHLYPGLVDNEQKICAIDGVHAILLLQ